jgi:hypothetical protein
VNDTPALATPLTVTTAFPVVAPVGTAAKIAPALQLLGVAATPLNVTMLVPWVGPKLVPVMVTDVPIAPELGDKPLTLGAASTVNDTPLQSLPPTVATTFPVVAPAGTGATTEDALQLVGFALMPLKVTVLVPWLEPKLLPVILTGVPSAPEVGDKAVIFGAAAFSWCGK